MSAPCTVCGKSSRGTLADLPVCAQHMEQALRRLRRAAGPSDDAPVLERVARSTGTRVLLYHRTIESDPATPWTVVCEAHGACVSHKTRALAEQWLAAPEGWCDECVGRKAQ